MRNTVLSGIAVTTIGAGIFLYATHRRDDPRPEPAPVIVVRHGPEVLPATPTPAKIAAAMPAARPIETPPVTSAPQPQPDDGPPPVDLLSGPIENMRQRLAYERRKSPDAARAEIYVQTRYDQLKGIGSAGRKIDVICGLSACQVSGSIESMPGGSTNDVMEAVQSDALMQDMAAKGYEFSGTTFAPGAGGRGMFVTYYSRSASRPPI